MRPVHILTPAQRVKEATTIGRAAGGLFAYLIAAPILLPIALVCGVREVLAGPEYDDEPLIDPLGALKATLRKRG